VKGKSGEFRGKWKILQMEQWDPDYIDLEVQGYIRFDSGHHGDLRFGAVEGDLDCRMTAGQDGVARVEFSWAGWNDRDPASGRGWAEVRDGKLYGHLYFHRGDESWFKAEKAKR
jgi:hypothetical protein